MKKQLLFLIASLLPIGMQAQESVTLKGGTPVKLHVQQKVYARNLNAGDKVNFTVAEDVVVDGSVALRQGALVVGTVDVARKSTVFGTRGRLCVKFDKIDLPSGQTVPLDESEARAYGKSRRAWSYLGYVYGFGAFIPGTAASLSADKTFVALVAENTTITK